VELLPEKRSFVSQLLDALFSARSDRVAALVKELQAREKILVFALHPFQINIL
jgi:hypothetical protein